MGLFLSTPQCCSGALGEGLFIAFGWHYLSPSPPQPYLLPASRTNLCAFLLRASLSLSTFSWGEPSTLGGFLSDGCKVCYIAHRLLASAFCKGLGYSRGEVTLWIETILSYIFLCLSSFHRTQARTQPAWGLAGRAWGWALHIKDPGQDCVPLGSSLLLSEDGGFR